MMRTATTLRASSKSDPGVQRTVNEDRVHVDPLRGVLVVIDGVGGQAAGGKAADVALKAIRARLERETGSAAARVREALTHANNEIHRLASTRPEWHGMACVATVLVVDGTRATVGHVGDTRLYHLLPGGIQKVTRDHSPVGEREDAGELTETEAMRHSRRNEVYRDLGSDRHEAGDPDFIDITEMAFEADSALLLCSDGLTDLIDSSAIDQIVRRYAGDADSVVSALIDAANRAGGKDNVTVAYVEGDRFRPSLSAWETTRRLDVPGESAAVNMPASFPGPAAVANGSGASGRERYVRFALLVMLTIVVALSIRKLPVGVSITNTVPTATPISNRLVVKRGESIAAALKNATAGSEVVVEPGEYREAVSLASDIRLVSLLPGGATLRLPATAQEADAAVVASGIVGGALIGFRIVGDAATALGTGLLVRDSTLTIADVEITGATNVAVDIAGASQVTIMASDVHDNPGAALAVRSGSSARITHNVFIRNGVSPQTPAAIQIEEQADLRFTANTFYDVPPAAFRAMDESARAAVARDNWFLTSRSRPAPPRTAAPARGRGRPGGLPADR